MTRWQDAVWGAEDSDYHPAIRERLEHEIHLSRVEAAKIQRQSRERRSQQHLYHTLAAIGALAFLFILLWVGLG